MKPSEFEFVKLSDLISPEFVRSELARVSREHLRINDYPQAEIDKLSNEEAIYFAHEHMAQFLRLRP